MLSLRILLCSLVYSLSINTSIASENIDSNAVFLQNEQPIVIARGPEDRQRGACETGIPPKKPPSIWALDICRIHQSSICYATPKEVNLWLEKRPERTVKVRIKNLNTSKFVKLSWKASDPTLDWPEDTMPIISGASYEIKIANRTFKYNGKILIS